MIMIRKYLLLFEPLPLKPFMPIAFAALISGLGFFKESFFSFKQLMSPHVSAYFTMIGSVKPWGMLPPRFSLIHFASRNSMIFKRKDAF